MKLYSFMDSSARRCHLVYDVHSAMLPASRVTARLLRPAVGQKTADKALKQLKVPRRRRCERRLVRLR